MKFRSLVFMAAVVSVVSLSAQTVVVPGGSVGDSGNSFVGIGTSSPDNALDVVHGSSGTMNKGFFELASFERDSDAKFGVYNSSSSSGDAAITLGFTNRTDSAGNYPGFEIQNMFNSDPNLNRLRFNALGRGSSGAVVAATPDILNILGNGRVGIGTAEPDAVLDLVASGPDVSVVRVDGRSLGSRAALNLYSALPVDSLTGRAFGIAAGEEGFHRSVFYANGFYGIGPGNATRDVFIGRSRANTIQIASQWNGGGTADLEITGRTGIGGITPSYDLDVDGDINFTGVLRQNGSPVTFGGGVGGSLWSENSSNVYYSTGNVGVGTSTPTHQLEVVGTSHFEGEVTLGTTSGILVNNGGDARLRVGHGDGLFSVYSESTDYKKLQYGGAQLNLIGDYDLVGWQNPVFRGQNMHDFTSESFRLFSSTGDAFFGGNVGIGAQPSTHALHVDGDIHFTGALLQNGVTISSGDPFSGTYGGDVSFTATTQATTKDTGALVVEGGVGIEKNLHVGGEIRAFNSYPRFGRWANDSAQPTISFDSNDGFRFNTSNNEFQWVIGGSLKAELNSGRFEIRHTQQSTSVDTGALTVDGGVGIASDLQVGGTVHANSVMVGAEPVLTASDLAGYVAATGTDVITGGASGLALNAAASGDADITLSPAGTGAVFVNGNLGVGTSTPQASLDVAGGARLSGDVSITSLTDSSGVASGALTVAGGLGVEKAVWLGNKLEVANNIYARGDIHLTDDILSYHQSWTDIRKIGAGDYGVRLAHETTAAAAAELSVTREVSNQPGDVFFDFYVSNVTNGDTLAKFSNDGFNMDHSDVEAFVIAPTYTQDSGNYSATDLLIDSTVAQWTGSGSHQLIDARVNGSSQFSVSSGGDAVIAGNLDLESITINGIELGLSNFVNVPGLYQSNPSWLSGFSADKLDQGTLDPERLPGFSGDVVGSIGSNNLTLSSTGVTVGTYQKVTVDTKGRVLSGTDLVPQDVVDALGYTPFSDQGGSVNGSVDVTSLTLNNGNLSASTGALLLSSGGADSNVVISPAGSGVVEMGGSVGVGTSAPSSELDVAGDISENGQTLLSKYAINYFQDGDFEANYFPFGESMDHDSFSIDGTVAYRGSRSLKFDLSAISGNYRNLWNGNAEYKGHPEFREGDRWTLAFWAKNETGAGFSVGYAGGGGYLTRWISGGSTSWNYYKVSGVVPAGASEVMELRTDVTSINGSLWIDDVVLLRGDHTATLAGDYIPSILPGLAASRGRLYVSDSGNVGIGTQSPEEKLDIEGNLKVDGHISVQIESDPANNYREVLAGFGMENLSDSKLIIHNGTSADTSFSPAITGYQGSAADKTGLALLSSITSGIDEVGNDVPMFYLQAHRTDSVTDPINGNFTSVQNRPLLQMRNYQDVVWEMDATGNTDFTKNLNVGGGAAIGGMLTAGLPAANWGNVALHSESGWGPTKHPTIGSSGEGGNGKSIIMMHNPHIPFRTDNIVPGYAGKAAIRAATSETPTSWWDFGLGGDFYYLLRRDGPSDTYTEFLRVTNAGRMGIGTTNPTQLLDVNGTSRFVGEATFNSLVNVEGNIDVVGALSVGQVASTLNNLGLGAADSPTFGSLSLATGQLSSPTGDLTFSTTDSSGNIVLESGISGRTEVRDTLAITNSAGTQSLLMGNQADGGTDNPVVLTATDGALTISGGDSWVGTGGVLDSHMTILDSGLMGINIDTPAHHLHIFEDIRPNYYATLFLDAAPDRNANLAFGIDGSFAANIRIADDNLDQLQLYTGSDITNGISIAQTGSVSVGSTDIEDAALYVYEDSESDSIKIESDSDSSPNLKFARNGSDFANIRVSDQGEDRFEIQVGTNLEHGIGILQNGKVVVGDAPATAKFNVSLTNGTTIGPPTTADLANAALLVRESGLSLAFDPNQIVSDATAINLQNINPAGVIRLHAGRSDDPHVIVESDGDVVIAQDLNVSQSIEANTINADVITVQNNAVITTAEFDPSNFVAADGGSSISAVSLTSTSGNVNGGSSGLILNAGGAGDQDVSINPTGGGSAKIYGDVTIGTESENQDLYVEGTVRAREIIVDQESWADHVFSSDYQLASLDQVEQHIDRNGHLPGIPSEAEVKQEGVSVGQMQMLLLQKVEELTLHIIAQEKRIESLEQELETARNK